jgi:hypothetical protein
MQFLHNWGDQSSSPFNFSFKVSKIRHLPRNVTLLKLSLLSNRSHSPTFASPAYLTSPCRGSTLMSMHHTSRHIDHPREP